MGGNAKDLGILMSAVMHWYYADDGKINIRGTSLNQMEIKIFGNCISRFIVDFGI